MFEEHHKEPRSVLERTPENRLAETICSVGYDLARIYCVRQGGNEVLERRCNLSSDQDFVYRARWYMGEGTFAGMRSDLIFYREPQDTYRLHIITRPDDAEAGPSGLSSDYIVEGRRPLSVWQRLVERSIPHSDHVLDEPTGFEWKRASINYHHPRGEIPGSERQMHLQRRDLLCWGGEPQLDLLKVEELQARAEVSLAEIVPRIFSPRALALLIEPLLSHLNEHLIPLAANAVETFRSEHLSANAVGESIADMKRLPLVKGVSLYQLQLLSQYSDLLISELHEKGKSLPVGRQLLYQLSLANIKLAGPTVVRLALCCNAFDSSLFSESVTGGSSGGLVGDVDRKRWGDVVDAIRSALG